VEKKALRCNEVKVGPGEEGIPPRIERVGRLTCPAICIVSVSVKENKRCGI
jgi:hypothetical protein